MSGALWKHQEDAATFALARRGSLLSMAMGTGKSRVAIEFARRVDARRILILCPLAVIPAWGKQFGLYGKEDLSATLLSNRAGSVKKRAALALAAAARPECVVVVNYESARAKDMATALYGVDWDLLVLDESHRLKAPFGATSKFCMGLVKRARRVLLLTGTPMPHSPMDIFAQARLADPSAFGFSFVQFRSRYAVMGGFENREVKGWVNSEDMKRRIDSFTFSCGNDVLDLPPEPLDIEVPIELEPGTMKAYRSLERHLVAEVESGVVTAANALVSLLRLQQLTGGVAPVDQGDGTTRAERLSGEKAAALREIVEDTDEPIVVFCRFIQDLDSVHEQCREAGVACKELSGRKKELEDWQSGFGRVLAVQIQAGGVGVDLTRAALGVYWSTGFSLGDYLQSRARMHRPGQTRHVRYMHLVAQDTIDVKVAKALRAKEEIVESILKGIKSKEVQV